MARKFNRTQKKRGGGNNDNDNDNNNNYTMHESVYSRRSRRPIKLTKKGEDYRKKFIEELEKKVSKKAMRELNKKTTAELQVVLAGLAKLGL